MIGKARTPLNTPFKLSKKFVVISPKHHPPSNALAQNFLRYLLEICRTAQEESSSGSIDMGAPAAGCNPSLHRFSSGSARTSGHGSGRSSKGRCAGLHLDRGKASGTTTGGRRGGVPAFGCARMHLCKDGRGGAWQGHGGRGSTERRHPVVGSQGRAA